MITGEGCARGMAQVTLALIALSFILIGIAFGGDKILNIIGGQLDHQAAINEHERQERIRDAETETEVEKIQALRSMEIAVSGAWLIFRGGLALVALAISGAFATAAWRLALGQVRSMREGWATAYARASRQSVPQTITYSPAPRVHYSVKNDNALPDVQPPLLPLLPDFTDLMTISLPAPEFALLGLGPDGKQITNSWEKAKHVAIVGPTGGGKSVLSKTLIVQSLRSGHDVHILDPHFTRFDAETGEDWTPVTSRLQAQPVTRIADISSRLAWAVGEMERRLELREQGEKYLPHIIRLVLDEVPAIVEQDEEAAKLISRVLREGRKVGVLLQMASQDMLAKTLGFKDGAAVRKNFSTAFIMRGCDPTSTRLFIKGEFSADALDVGIAGIVTEGQRGHTIARIPYTSNEAVERILAQPAAPTLLLASTPQIPTSPQSPLVAPQVAPISPLLTAEEQRRAAGESSDSGGGSAVAVGGGSAKEIAFAIWDVNKEASYEAVMEIAGIEKRSTIRAYKAQWRKARSWNEIRD